MGDFSGVHGLSQAAQYDLAHLRERHTSLTIVDINQALAGKEVKPAILNEKASVLYLFCQPDTYQHALKLLDPQDFKDCYRIGKWVWETPIFPSSWAFAESVVHEVWTPSQFCHDTFKASLTIPVRVVPYFTSIPAPSSDENPMRQRLGISEKAFMGLGIMDIKSCPERKNPWDHIRVWISAFDADPEAVLVLKVRTSKRTALVLDELKELIGERKNIILIATDLSSEDMASLRSTANVYLSLHRSEGYGLTIHEALLSGISTLATDWSANSEFGQAYQNYVPLRYTLVRYRDWLGHYEDADFSWAQVVLPYAVDRLKDLYTRHRSPAQHH